MYTAEEGQEFCNLVRTSTDPYEVCYALIELIKKITPEEWEKLGKGEENG